jgi:hypothetical protein
VYGAKGPESSEIKIPAQVVAREASSRLKLKREPSLIVKEASIRDISPGGQLKREASHISIVHGAMDLKNKTVENALVPLHDVYMLGV